MALYRNDRNTVNISKPSTLSSTKGIDNTVISEFDPVSIIFDMTRENSANGSQNTNHQYVTKRRVSRNRTTNSMTNNTLIVHGSVGGEIKQIKRLSIKPTKVVDSADYSSKIDMDNERPNALRSHSKLKKETLPVVNDAQLPVEKQKTSNMDFERRQYDRFLTTLQQNSSSYIGNGKDYHDQSKSKLLPSISKDRATRRHDDRQQPNTYVAGEI